MSRLLHPDRYHGARRRAQYSLEATAILNDAYRVLRDPVSRAEYVLKELGFTGAGQRSKETPPELLEEVFVLNMVLEECAVATPPCARSSKRRALGFCVIGGDRRKSSTDCTGALTRRKTRRVGEIRASLDRRRYIQNLVREVEERARLMNQVFQIDFGSPAKPCVVGIVLGTTNSLVAAWRRLARE